MYCLHYPEGFAFGTAAKGWGFRCWEVRAKWIPGANTFWGDKLHPVRSIVQQYIDERGLDWVKKNGTGAFLLTFETKEQAEDYGTKWVTHHKQPDGAWKIDVPEIIEVDSTFAEWGLADWWEEKS